MKHAIACLNTQLGILLHNASVFHGEGREEDRDRNIAEADDLRMAVEALRDEVPLSERMGLDPADPWEESAKQFSRDVDFYRSIVTRIGELYGDAAKRRDDGTMSQDVLALAVPELVETSVKQFRLLASFVGSKATSHTEIVSDTAAEIRALRTSLEAERQRTLEAERKLGEERQRHIDAERELEFRDYRFLNVGEKLEFTDQYSPGDGTWHPVTGSEGTVGSDEEWKYRRPWKGYPGYRMLGADEKLQYGDEYLNSEGRWVPTMEPGNRVGRKYVGRYRRPIPLDTEPEKPETPAA